MLLAILLILFPLKVVSETEYECYDFSHFEVTVESEAVFEAERTVAVTHTDLYTLISQYDWNVEIAYAVMMAESNGVASAVNWNDVHNGCVGSMGVFQLACFWAPHFGYAVEDLYDPVINVALAHKIWQGQGWRPWSAYLNGSFRNYLN